MTEILEAMTRPDVNGTPSLPKRAALERQEAEALRHRQVVAFLEDPEGYKSSRVGKRSAKVEQAPPSTFSIVGGRPSGGAGVA